MSTVYQNGTQFESAEDIHFNLAFTVFKGEQFINLDGFGKLRAYTYNEKEDDSIEFNELRVGDCRNIKELNEEGFEDYIGNFWCIDPS